MKTKNRRRMSSLAKKRQKLQSKPSLQLESLEDRHLLTASWNNFGAPTSASESASSGGPTLLFQAADIGQTVTIQLGYGTVTGPTAAEANDSSLAPLTMVVPASGTIDLLAEGAFQVNNDHLVEGNEVVAIQVLSTTLGFQGTQNTTHTIVDNESASVEIGNTITEGSGGPTIKLTTVSADLNPDNDNKPFPATLEETFSVSVKDTTGGSATVQTTATTSGAFDVQFIPDQTVFFGANSGNGVQSGFFTQANNDALVEGTETVLFNLEPSKDYVPDVFGDALEVKDAQSVSASFVMNPLDPNPMTSVEDANTGDKFVDVILTLPQGGSLASSLTLPVTIGGTATQATTPFSDPNLTGDRDYHFDAPVNPNSITFPAGSVNGAKITYEIDAESGLRDDAVLEGNETVTMKLGAGSSIASIGNANYTLTIVDDEAGAITVNRVNEDRTEGTHANVEYTFTVNSTGGSVAGVGPIVVPYSLIAGAAAPIGALPTDTSDPPNPWFPDYNIGDGNSGTVTIPFNAGTSSTVTLQIPIVNDNQTEGDETVTISVANPTIGIPVSITNATTTIKDDDSSTVNVGILTSTFGGDTATKEDDCAFGSVNGTAGATCTSDDGRFEITLSQASSTPTVVKLVPTGTAKSNIDYSAFPTSVTIPAWATTSGAFTLQIFDDAIVESVETIGIKIDSITSADPQISIGVQEDFISIVDTPDNAVLTLTASDPIASESTTFGVDNGQFLFSLDKLVDVPITVGYTITGTAANGTDYVSIPATFTIPANVFAAPINIQVIDDLLSEGSETVTLTLNSVTPGSGLLAGQLAWTSGQNATVTINDDEILQVSVITSDGSAAEAPGTTANPLNPGQFKVELSKASTSTVTVNYAFTGSASAADFTGSPVLGSGTLTFTPGQTSQVFDYNILDDGLIEGTENLILTLTSPSGGGATLGTTVGTINITDNDTAGATVTAQVSPAAENGGVGKFAFNLASTSTTDTTINFTVGGVAVNNSDYQIFTQDPATTTNPAVLSLSGNAGSIVIPKNTTGPVCLWVRGLNDVLVEGDEGVTITPTSTSNSSITVSGSATVNIADDDSALISIVEVDDKAFEDPSTGNTTASFQLSVNNPNVVRPMQVQYTLTGAATQSHGSTQGDVIIGGAVTTSNTTGYILVNPGVTSLNIPITAVNDFLVEGTEALTMQLTGIVSTTNLSGVGFNPTASNASADICDDDDGAEVFMTFQNLTDTTADEENTSDKVPIFVGLTQPSSAATVVRFSVGGSGIDADAEFNPAIVGGSPVFDTTGIGHDDYMIVGQTGQPTPVFAGQNAITGRYEYTITIPAFASSAVFNMMANDDDGTAGTGVVEGTEIVNIRLTPNAATNYSNSGNLSQVNPAIVESDKAYVTITDHRTGAAKTAATGVPVIGATDPAVVESGSANAVITVHSDIEGELDVFYQFVPGTAVAGGDYADPGIDSFLFVNTTAGTTNAIVAPGQPLLIDPTNDAIFESTENFKIQLFATHSNNGLTDQLGFGVGDFSTVEILDDDQISLNVANSVTEKNGTDTTTVPVTVTVNPTIAAGTFTITTSDGTAVDSGTGVGSNDYNGANGTAVWNGSNSFTSNTLGDGNTDATLSFNVVVNGDDVVEGDQTFTITIAAPGVANAVQTVTIVDNDTVKITAVDTTVNEGATSSPLQITTDKAIEGNVTFKLNVNESTATKEDLSAAGIQGDFDPVAEQSVSISGAAGTFTLGTSVNTSNSNDTVVEGDEIANIVLSSVQHNPVGGGDRGAVNPVNGKVTITETGQEAIVFTSTPTSITLTEGASASVNVKLTGTGGATSSVPITVNPVTANGSAVGGADFGAIAAGGQPLNFSGTLNQTLTATVSTFDDNVIEAQEGFNLTFPAGDISVNTGASITAPASVPITVNDNDSATVEIRTETSGAEGSPDGSFQVGFSNGKVTDVDVFVSIGVSGSATAIGDYDLSTPPPFLGAPFSTTAPSYIAVIPAGQSSATVTVDIVDDSIVETTELVTLTEQSVIPASPRSISSPAVGSAADTGSIAIVDNDGVTTPTAFALSGTGWGSTVAPASVSNGSTAPWAGINEITVGTPAATAPGSLLLYSSTVSGTSVFAATLQNAGSSASAQYFVNGLTSGLPSGKYRLANGSTNLLTFNVNVADHSGNGAVGFEDFGAMAATFGTTTSGTAPATTDFNANGIVDFGDFSLLAATFTTNINSLPAPVPPAPAPVVGGLSSAIAAARSAQNDYSRAIDDIFGSIDDDDDQTEFFA